MTRDWYTPAQVAEHLQVDEDAVRRWIATGALRAVNVGAGTIRPRWRVSADALEAFIAVRANRVPVKQQRRQRAVAHEFV